MWLKEVRRRKAALHTSSHLTQTGAWWSAVSTTLEGRRVSSEVRLENCTQVWGLGQIWTACDSRLRKNSASHLFWLVQTCPNLSTMQWPCTLVAQCHFSHFWMFLFFGLTSYPAEIAYFNSPDCELSNGVRVMALHSSTLVDPSVSPCLKTIDGKTFERRHFLVLRLVLLKIAYFNSANGWLSKDIRPVELR